MRFVMLPPRRMFRRPGVVGWMAAVVAGVVASAPVWATQPFTVVVIPDTQYYTRTESRNDLYFKGQTSWIAAHREARSIVFAMHLGDIQNDGNPYFARTDDIYLPDFTRPTGLVADDAQFRRASEAIEILDSAGVPYSLLPGNHDFLDHTIKDEPIYYLKWFGPQRYADMPTFGGASPATPTTPWAGLNTWHTFEAAGYQFLNIAMQFAPDQHDLAWAQSVINANPGLPTILTTHALLNTTGYQSAYRGINDLFVRNNPQVLMTINGHITGAFHQTVTNIAGQPVHQMLTNYQFQKFPGFFDGGGYLRTLEFDVEAATLRVETYSPIADAHLTDAANRFTLPLEIASRFGRQQEPGLRTTVAFREGLGGYSSTVDTYISAAAPSTSYASATGLWVDTDAETAGVVQPRQALLRFDDLFGDNAIPVGAVIDSAALTIRTSTTPNSHSANTIGLYRLLSPWNDSSTWNSLGEGITANGSEAILAPNAAFVPSVNGGTLTFDVTESLFAWGSGAPNYGWAFLPGGTDGWRFDSAETTVAENRPTLTVTYTVRAATSDIVIDVPDSRRTQAQLGYPTISLATSVTKNGPGVLVMDAANSYTGPTTVRSGTLEVTNPNALGATNVTVADNATLMVATGIAIRAPSVDVRGGTLSASTIAVNRETGIASLAVHAGSLEGAPLVMVGSGGTISLAREARVSIAIGGLDVDESSGGGRLDVGAGIVTVAAAGISEMDVRADIIAGRHGGSWNGTTGITSRSAAAAGGTRAVGYVVMPDGSATVSFAAPGDVDLGGRVDVFDLVSIQAAGAYGTGRASVWSQGDFDYDGLTNVFDLISINTAAVYGQGDYFPAAPSASGLGSAAVVPEPHLYRFGMGLVVLGCWSAGAFRRGRSPASLA
jgi:autotransporter-associated beta strand protein